MKGFVSNIQRFCINDGPGIRTTVFLKGCNLNCLWCHNPESISAKQEIQYFERNCRMCGKCIEVCPENAHYINGNNEKIFDRKKCKSCGLCIENCFFDALVFAAKYMEAYEVVDIVAKDIDYHMNSGGGLTISGGEPLLQKEFVREVFDKTKALGIHNAIDTAANVSWEDFESVLPSTDLVLLDLKVMDSDIHKRMTGVSNERILRNGEKLSQYSIDMIVRIPVVSGINDTEENMVKTAEYLRGFKRLLYVEFLPYHNLGMEKLASLGQESPRKALETPSKGRLQELVRYFEKYDIEVRVE